MAYKIKNGKIEANLIELNVVHHCNLSCRACSHLSHRAETYFINPDQVYKDLRFLADYYHPQHVRLLGGEPLLHPDLLDVIDAVRASQISEKIRIVTNGILLDRMPESFWQKVDEVFISLYPFMKLDKKKLSFMKSQSRQFDVDLEIQRFNHFRESVSKKNSDTRLVERIYSTCQIVHNWGCHAVSEGYLYRCSPSMIIPKIFKMDNKACINKDRLALSPGNDFAEQLNRFLTGKKPLQACQHCLGTVGKRFVPIQLSKAEYPLQPAGDLIDWKYLNYYEFIGNQPIPLWLQQIGHPVKRFVKGLFH